MDINFYNNVITMKEKTHSTIGIGAKEICAAVAILATIAPKVKNLRNILEDK